MKRLVFIFIAIFSVFGLSAQVDSTAIVATSVAQPQEDSVDSMNMLQIWDRANTEYINERYAEAIKLYQEILTREKHSAPLYYNLGNAYFKNGELGRALKYYYRAEKLDPTNADIQYNIEVAKSHTKDRIEEIPPFILAEWSNSLRSIMGGQGWGILSLLGFLMMFTFALIYLLSRDLAKRKVGFYGILGSLFAAVVSMVYAVSISSEYVNSDDAVVMSQSMVVKSSPDRKATELFILHEGTKVHIISEHDDWREIKIADGKQGWVEVSRLGVIGH
ncbi:MAG: tetratricopeptide repeat protein [Rikenellaceae bacterium]